MIYEVKNVTTVYIAEKIYGSFELASFKLDMPEYKTIITRTLAIVKNKNPTVEEIENSKINIIKETVCNVNATEVTTKYFFSGILTLKLMV